MPDLPRRPPRRRDLLARAVRLRGREPHLRGQRRPRLHAAAAASGSTGRPSPASRSRWCTSCSRSTPTRQPRVEVVILSRNDPVSGHARVPLGAALRAADRARRVHARPESPWRYLRPLGGQPVPVGQRGRRALGARRRRAGGARLSAFGARVGRASERGAHRLRRRRGAVLRRGRAGVPARRARRLPGARARPRRDAAARPGRSSRC